MYPRGGTISKYRVLFNLFFYQCSGWLIHSYCGVCTGLRRNISEAIKIDILLLPTKKQDLKSRL